MKSIGVLQTIWLLLSPTVAITEVRLHPDRVQYSYGERISIIVENNGSERLRSLLNGSYCTAVHIEVFENAGWKAALPCRILVLRSGIREIPANNLIEIEVPPVPPSALSNAFLPPGRYRLRFSFWTLDDRSDVVTVYSDEFLVQ